MGMVLSVGGCMAGERPSFNAPPQGGSTGTSVGDPNVDAVLVRLESGRTQAFTASYDLVRRLGNVQRTATVAEDGTGRRSVTIGDVRYLSNGNSQRTCQLTDGTCDEGLNEARVSDTGLASRFDTFMPARRLRIANDRREGATTAETVTIAGESARCVTIPVGAGREMYCVLDAGVIARWDAADVHVELTDFDSLAAEPLFHEEP
jgi:hypothetical protein